MERWHQMLSIFDASLDVTSVPHRNKSNYDARFYCARVVPFCLTGTRHVLKSWKKFGNKTKCNENKRSVQKNPTKHNIEGDAVVSDIAKRRKEMKYISATLFSLQICTLFLFPLKSLLTVVRSSKMKWRVRHFAWLCPHEDFALCSNESCYGMIRTQIRLHTLFVCLWCLIWQKHYFPLPLPRLQDSHPFISNHIMLENWLESVIKVDLRLNRP